LAEVWVMGLKRVPAPPDNTSAFIVNRAYRESLSTLFLTPIQASFSQSGYFFNPSCMETRLATFTI
jgi:hypothetical protein